jgi:hypothetical protein
MTVSHQILLRIRNVSDKSCRENKSAHFMFSNFFFGNHAIYKIMSKNVMESEAADDNMAAHCWIINTAFTQAHASHRNM